MKWEEYNDAIQPQRQFSNREQVDVECPKCGKKIWRRNDIVLPTYPAKYQYECDCGWIGYARA